MIPRELVLASTLFLMLVATAGQSYAATSPPSPYSELKGTPTFPVPQVLFPSESELASYFNGKNVSAPTFISNETQGNVTDIQAAKTDTITYVAFQTMLNNTDHIFLSIVQDPTPGSGFSYSQPIEITPKAHGVLSHLQIAANKNKEVVVWQDHNSTSGLNSIFVSSSMESGKQFRTYRASANNTDAFDPVLPFASNGLMLWKQAFDNPTPGEANDPGTVVYPVW